MFFYLENATMRLPDQEKKMVFEEMAYMILHSEDVTREDIEYTLLQFGMSLNKLCESCNEVLPSCACSFKKTTVSKKSQIFSSETPVETEPLKKNVPKLEDTL